jgi:hypothetical protein
MLARWAERVKVNSADPARPGFAGRESTGGESLGVTQYVLYIG